MTIYSLTKSYRFRVIVGLTMKSPQTKQERNVKHMQYMAWPDHGVPDSPETFLRFTQHVREARGDSPAPVIVHCSAGIGRTGVLVLMESALCLIEAAEPIYPLDIVQTMRKQRAMMIQNAVGVLWFYSEFDSGPYF